MKNLNKRVLVPIVGQGSITHIIRTGMLARLKGSCTPIIALLWQEEGLVAELKAQGYEVTFFPPYKVSPAYSSARYKVNLWYIHHKLKTPSISIQQKYLSQFKKAQPATRLKKQLRDTYHQLRFKFQPQYINHILQQEASLVLQEEVYKTFSSWLTDLQIEGLFTVTPFLPEVDLIARILKQRNIPVIASIHSFDNVTKRGWQSTVFDHYIVWNKYNKAELQRIHQVLEKDNCLTIAGAPQFDFHFNEAYTWPVDEWKQRLGLPLDKKIILYSGGPVALLPDEPQYLLALKQAFDTGKISDDYVVLFRCHPLDRVERWKQYVGESPYIIYDYAPNGAKKLDHVNVVDDDIKKLMSTLKHTEVHINVVSTMCVDGSAFDKPQIGPYYDAVNPETEDLFRQMYYQEHYRPIMNTGVINLAYKPDEYITLINDVLKQPGKYTAKCKACLQEIITYSDGKSTERAVAAIQNFFAA